MTAWPRWSDSVRLAVVGLAATVGVGLVAEWRSVGFGDLGVWLPDLLVGSALAAAGAALLVAEYRQVAVVLTTSGLVWFAGNFAAGGPDGVAALSHHLALAHRALVLAAVLAFPFGLWRRRVECTVATAAFAALLPDAASEPWWTTAWAVGALAAFAMVVRRRNPLLRAAGRQVMPVMVTFAFVLAVTATMRVALGDAPPTRITVLVYQAGIAATAVHLVERAIDWRRRAAVVADAVVEIALGPGGNVRALLSKALRDPSVEVAFASIQDGHVSWFDEAGTRTDRLAQAGRSIVPIAIDGEPIAEVATNIELGSAPALLAAITSATGRAAEHARLRADLRRQIETLTASRRRLLSVADEERVALAAQLEREAGRSLRAIRTLLDDVSTGVDGGVADAACRSRARLDSLGRDLDSLAAGLGPVALSDGRLDEALRELAAGSTTPIVLTVDGSTASLPSSEASTLYFVCAEAVANAIKHSDASTVHVTLHCAADGSTLRVEDDGCGGADPGTGLGLPRLLDRVAALGGRLHLDSTAGAGTRITAEIPRSEHV